MIPKIIHYCWFGGNPKSEKIQQCIESWKKYCPDFEIIEWNENNAKVFANKFYKNALRKKKYAFVADYVRSKALYEKGGIYLDTDMLILKPIDELLKYNFFTAEEVENRVAYGFFGAAKNHLLIKKMIDYYNHSEFNEFSPPVITHTFSVIINKDSISENEMIFSPNYFYPLTYQNRDEDYTQFITNDTYAVHLWEHSWKKKTEESFYYYFKNCLTVVQDFLFYGYSISYFKRYFKEFSRKMFHVIKAKL